MSNDIKLTILLIIGCLALSSCETVRDVQENEALKTVGSFQLNPVHPNSYWYDGKSYEYNEYEIMITSDGIKSRIKWNGKYVGDTPLSYKFTGTLDKDEYVKVQALPYDEKIPAQEGNLRIREELPRKINFNFKQNAGEREWQWKDTSTKN